MNLTDVYGYIKKNLADDYSVLKNKVDEFAGEGLEPIRIYNILSQYIALKPFCRALDVKNGDYIEFIKAIKIATFLKAKFNNEDAISVMQNTLIYEDNDVCIFKPTNFQESSIIGEPICCFAYSQGRWDEHYYGYQEAIYYVYDVMRENSIHDFVAITVRPSGRALILDKEHNWWSPADSIRYIKGLGEGAATIVTKEGKSIKTENKQYKTNTNMNKKLIRLTEQDLHKIVKESVNRALKEARMNNGLRKCTREESEWFEYYGYRAADGWYGKWCGNDVMQFCDPRGGEITEPIKGERRVVRIDGEDVNMLVWDMPNGIPSQYECDIDFDN